MTKRNDWTSEENEICVKHYSKLGGAGIIEEGYITNRTANAINAHCRTMLKLSCDGHAIKMRAHKIAKERGTFVHSSEAMRRRGKAKYKRTAPEPESHPGHKMFAGLSSIFAVGAA